MVDQQVAIAAGISMWVGSAEAGEKPSIHVKLPGTSPDSTVYHLIVRSIEELRTEILALRSQIRDSPNDENTFTPAATTPAIGGSKETSDDFVRRASKRIADADELTQRMQAQLDKPTAAVQRDKNKGKGSEARSA
jgi:hypothetical protein